MPFLPKVLILILLAAAGALNGAHAAQFLRLGTNVWPGYDPLYIAADREDWEQTLRVRVVEYPSASEVLRAFRNKALEAAALTLDEVLALREAGLPLKVVTVLDISAGGDVILGKPEISDFKGLRGKRIAVESGALGAYMITRALELNRMTLDDVEVIPIDVSSQEAAYHGGQVDAVVTFEPVKTRLLASGANELFSSREIPGEIVDVLVVHEEFVDSQPEQIRQLVSGWFRALAFRSEQPRLAAGLMARRQKISPDEILNSYEGLRFPGPVENRRLLEGELKPTLVRLQQTLLREGLIDSSGPVDTLLEPRLLPR